MDRDSSETRRSGGPGRVLAIMAVAALAIVAIAWALGLFDVETYGKLEAPNVAVTGGEVPDVEVDVADVDVGTKTETVEVPTVTVTPPSDDRGDKN